MADRYNDDIRERRERRDRDWENRSGVDERHRRVWLDDDDVDQDYVPRRPDSVTASPMRNYDSRFWTSDFAGNEQLGAPGWGFGADAFRSGVRGINRADNEYFEGNYGEGGGARNLNPDLSDWTTPGPHTGRGPANYRRSDVSIEEDVNERLTRHGQLDASPVSVKVEDGIVILEGEASDRRIKRMAEDTCYGVRGVRDVQNRMTIRRDDDDIELPD